MELLVKSDECFNLKVTEASAVLTYKYEQSSIIVSRLLQSLGLILHRENARSILRRYPRCTGQDCGCELLAASAGWTTNGDLNHPVY